MARYARSRSPRDPVAKLSTATVSTASDEDLLKAAAALLSPAGGRTFGLRWDMRWAEKAGGPKDEKVRSRVRFGTRDKVAKELGLACFGKPLDFSKGLPAFCKDIVLFRGAESSKSTGGTAAGGNYLMGRDDLVCVKAKADYDKDWNFIKSNRSSFWVMHAAALNIGESATTAADFPAVSSKSGLEEERYLSAMENLIHKIVQACKELSVKHFIFFPFGMGAFLRNLHKLDPSYADESRMQGLRRKVAARFAKALALDSSKSPPRIHLCLRFGTLEEQQNADAFIRALVVAGPALTSRLQIWPNGDSLQLAHDLSSRASKPKYPDVLLLNGANRSLLGNHWFGGGAKQAIDENLHRRSWMLSAMSYALNNYASARDRLQFGPDDLPKQVEKMGGIVRMQG